MTIDHLIREVQAKLNLNPDGIPGSLTWTAIHSAIVLDIWPDRRVDDRSEKGIQTLLPPVRPLARELILLALGKGIEIKVTSAHRSYEEQNALYEQGRSKPGNIVTNARGGYSSHNFGTAFDITIFRGATPIWESPDYQVVGRLGKSIGLSWGGDWSKPDDPHFYLKPDWAKDLTESQMMAQFRARKEKNQPIFT